MEKTISLAILFSFIILNTCYALSKNSSGDSPCSSPEASQFDFWVGEWKAEWENNDGTKSEGKNIISRILNGCVIEENFNGNTENDFKGKSFSVYNTQTNQWQQTWVDNHGGYMIFTGVYSGEKMILSRSFKNAEGKIIKQRMIFHNIKENSFEWNWEKSSDNAESWEVSWKIYYSRIN